MRQTVAILFLVTLQTLLPLLAEVVAVHLLKGPLPALPAVTEDQVEVLALGLDLEDLEIHQL